MSTEVTRNDGSAKTHRIRTLVPKPTFFGYLFYYITSARAGSVLAELERPES